MAALDGGLEPADLHHLVFVCNWRHTLPDWRWLHSALDRLAGAGGVDPLMADELRLQRAMVAVDEGRYEAAREYFRTMGGLQLWWASGPIDLEELEDFGANVVLPGADASWRPVHGSDPLGWIDLSGLAWPARRQLLYLATTISSDRDQAVAVRIGAAEVARVWLNGAEILTTPYPLERAEDQACGGGWLRAGDNLLVAAVAVEDSGWWLRARLTRPDGSPLDGVQERGGRPVVVPVERRAAPEVRSLVSEIERAIREGRDGARTAFAALLVLRHPEPVSSGAARTACREARAESPGEARLLEWFLISEPGAARQLLEEAIAADATLLWARVPLAVWYYQRGLRQQAMALLEEAGDEPLARAALADMEGAVFGPMVLAWLAELSRQQPTCVEMAAVLTQRAVDLDHWQLAREGMARLEGLVPGYRRVLALHEQLAADCGDSAALQQLVEHLVQSDPNRPALRMRLSRFLVASDRTGEAVEILREGLRRCPNHVELLGELARLEHAQGNDQQAVELSRQLLLERPQDRQARRLLERLDQESEDLSWLRSPEELWSMADAVAVEGAPAVTVLEHHELRFLPGRLTEERVQRAIHIGIAEQADSWSQLTLAHVPERQSLRVLAARLLRRDGSQVAARQSDTPRLSEPELNMYYDTRLRVLSFAELEDGDLIEISYILSETAEANETGPYQGGIIRLNNGAPIAQAEITLSGSEELLPAWELANPAGRWGVCVEGTVGPCGWGPHNREGAPSRTQDPDGTVHLSFVWHDLPAIPREMPAAPPLLMTPHLVYSSHPDWGELADWYARHVAPRIRVSQQVEEQAQKLTANFSGRRQRINALYRFVTSEIRYVGLELGEHRFRPFSADWVLNHRIGDCKDKAALLVTLLKAAGIPARMVLLRTADLGPVVADLALLQSFNHVIVYLPEDDLWLDGTATGHAMDLPPAMDQQALALVIEGADSRPLTTPFVGAGTSSYEYRLSRGEGGSVDIEVRVEDTGNAASSRRALLAGSNDPRRFSRWLQSLFPAAELTSEPKATLIPSRDPTLIELQGKVPRASLLGAGGIRVYPGTLGLVRRFAPTAGRSSPLLAPAGPDAEWVLEVDLGHQPEDLPESAELQTEFGRLQLVVEADAGSYRVSGFLHLVPGVIPAAKAAAYRDFLVAVERHLDRPLEVP